MEDYTDLQNSPIQQIYWKDLTHSLKEHYSNHNGLNEANKKKFIDGFINTKSRLK